MDCSEGSGHKKTHLLYDMQGPFFAAIAEVLRIKPCEKKCLDHLRHRKFSSVKDLVASLCSRTDTRSQNAVRDRLLMCCFFPKHSPFSDWGTLVHYMTVGVMHEQMQELFDEWLEKNHPRATTVLRALVLALRTNPPLTCVQAAFCLSPLSHSLVSEITDLLYRLLLRSCVKVRILPINDAVQIGSKLLAVQFTEEQAEPVLYYS